MGVCASETHYVCVVDSDGETVGQLPFQHSGTGLVEIAAWLLGATNTHPHAVGVAIEVPHGPVVETLMERGFTMHAVDPKQLDRFRDRWSPAGANDAGRDAWTLADALRTTIKPFGDWTRKHLKSLSFASGRASAAISPATRHGSSTVPVNNSGATTRSFSRSKAISLGPG